MTFRKRSQKLWFASLLLSSTIWAVPALAESKDTSAVKTDEKSDDKPKDPGRDSTELPKPVRGPADGFILGAGFGGGFGVHSGTPSSTGETKPGVLYGAMLNGFVGYAWSVRENQSLGTEFFVEGMYDLDRTTQKGTVFAGRYGAAFFVIGERAHLKAGLGYSSMSLGNRDLGGMGLSFAAGWHVPFSKSGLKNKHPVFTVEFQPAWDFLIADQLTVHRVSIGLRIGLALY